MAEDKQESVLDLAQDCEWIRALDAHGNSIRISKTDIIELFRKEMPVVTPEKKGLMNNNAFFNRGDINVGSWNNLSSELAKVTKSGMYNLIMGVEEWGTLIVFDISNYHGGVIQFVFRWTPQSFLFRISSERKIFTTDFKTV